MKVFVAVLVVVLACTEAQLVVSKAQKKCNRFIAKYEVCLNQGYVAKLPNCVSTKIALLGKKGKKACAKAERVAKKCGYTCDPPAPEYPCKRENTNFWGDDIRDFKAETFEDCAGSCPDEPGCVAITYRPSDKNCWLKRKRGGTFGPNPEVGVHSTNMVCVEPKKSCAQDETNFWGADLRNFSAENFDQCITLCADAQDCRSYTFRKSDSHCWLKNKDNGIWPKAEAGLISGNMNC